MVMVVHVAMDVRLDVIVIVVLMMRFVRFGVRVHMRRVRLGLGLLLRRDGLAVVDVEGVVLFVLVLVMSRRIMFIQVVSVRVLTIDEQVNESLCYAFCTRPILSSDEQPINNNVLLAGFFRGKDRPSLLELVLQVRRGLPPICKFGRCKSSHMVAPNKGAAVQLDVEKERDSLCNCRDRLACVGELHDDRHGIFVFRLNRATAKKESPVERLRRYIRKLLRIFKALSGYRAFVLCNMDWPAIDRRDRQLRVNLSQDVKRNLELAKRESRLFLCRV